VYDHLNRRALEVSFINDTAIQISGIFHTPGSRKEVIITADAIQVGSSSKISGYCAGGPVKNAVFAF
jgi:hypothetical protein